MSEHYRRLPLQGLHNARDLGGYPTKFGRPTKYGRFIRSEAPKNLTKEDLEYLKTLGVTLSVDLRGVEEAGAAPSILKDVPWLSYIQCPIFNEEAAGEMKKLRKASDLPRENFWPEVYFYMVENHRDWIRDVLETLGSANGAALFHCTTGKDRTGIISALLLSVAGADERDIIADYCVSQVYLRPVYNNMRRFMSEGEDEVNLEDPFFKTDPETMEFLLAHLNKNFGSTEEFIKIAGVSDKTVTKLRAMLLD